MNMEQDVEKVIGAANGTISRLKELRDKKGHLWAALAEFMLEVKVINSVDKDSRLVDMVGKVSAKVVIAVLTYAYSPEEVPGKLDELMADTDSLVDALVKEIK